LENVAVRNAVAADGNPGGRPYAVILLNGATETVPERIYGQLQDGGPLVGVFAMSQPQAGTLVTRSHGDFGTGRYSTPPPRCCPA